MKIIALATVLAFSTIVSAAEAAPVLHQAGLAPDTSLVQVKSDQARKAKKSMRNKKGMKGMKNMKGMDHSKMPM